MAGRTLMQQAQPVTFGLKAAGWLAGRVRRAGAAARAADCPRSSAAPPGTLSALGDRGPGGARSRSRASSG